MARVDVAVLGAGIVGTSVALQMARRSRSVALIDRGAPGEETSYGNSGVIEANTIFPPAFPPDLKSLFEVALKLAPQANYHLSFLPHVAPWLMKFRAASQRGRMIASAHIIRPLLSQALAEHETLMQESDALRYLRKTGWLKGYRDEASFDWLAPERDLARQFGIPIQIVDQAQVNALEPSLAPVFKRAVFWPQTASISNPLSVTRAYAKRFSARGGVILNGDARSLHRNGGHWRVDTEEGSLDADQVVVALGPWAPDLLEPLGIKLPMAVKRGYHRHFSARGNASLSRPVLDADGGYLITPMEQGIRITTGAEFADRDAPPTPEQFDRLLPYARDLFPLGDHIDNQRTWLGSRPCFPDSRPVIDRAPGQKGMWLAIGHAHWGLTLGPVTGRLIAEMMAGETPMCDPAPYRAERFN